MFPAAAVWRSASRRGLAAWGAPVLLHSVHGPSASTGLHPAKKHRQNEQETTRRPGSHFAKNKSQQLLSISQYRATRLLCRIQQALISYCTENINNSPCPAQFLSARLHRHQKQLPNNAPWCITQQPNHVSRPCVCSAAGYHANSRGRAARFPDNFQRAEPSRI